MLLAYIGIKLKAWLWLTDWLVLYESPAADTAGIKQLQ